LSLCSDLLRLCAWLWTPLVVWRQYVKRVFRRPWYIYQPASPLNCILNSVFLIIEFHWDNSAFHLPSSHFAIPNLVPTKIDPH
jgi:hypothetical protein